MSPPCACHDAPQDGTVISDQFNIPSGPVLGVHLNFRLCFHSAALNLLVRRRHAVVQSPPTAAELGLPADLPTAAIDVPDRRRFFNRRRERDPLGEGFACTWRTRLIKVAAEVITRARRVVVRLSASWPHLDHFLAVSRAVTRPVPDPSPG